MRVLVIGSGGREHALVWKLRQSPRISALYCAPGNAGIAEEAECVPIAADDVKGLLRFAEERHVDLTVVGPELPLTLGLVDRFTAAGLSAFGPTAAAAHLEGSKAFTKELLRHERVPTAFFGVFDDPDDAARYVREVGAPVVVKADGLASGKGVFICPTVAEALEAVDELMRARLLGDAGSRVVVEEFLEGEEVSFMALTDGTTVLPLAPSQDHKRALDGDRGPNTGGMGACSPTPIVTPALQDRILREIMEPVVRGLARQGVRYTGVLYAGLMVQDGHAKVLEFNVRFGDPEAQALLVRLRSDLLELIERACDGRLAGATIDWDARAAVCVVLAAEGYPGAVERGRRIEGVEALRAWQGGKVFHAGTKRPDGALVTDGGRVLGVTALGDTIEQAVTEAYANGRWVDMAVRDGRPQVGIVMGSDSDWETMEAAAERLKHLEIDYEVQVMSAHRSPKLVRQYAEGARRRGLAVLIAGAGGAAHLAGVVAAHTTLPVIGVPVAAGGLGGLDALLATVQMPPGVPVATVAIGRGGAENAAILAAQILSLKNRALRQRLERFKAELAESVEGKNLRLQRKLFPESAD